MRYKIMARSPSHLGESESVWALGYPTRSAASAAARRLKEVDSLSGHRRFRVEKMTAEDEALASELEQKYE